MFFSIVHKEIQSTLSFKLILLGFLMVSCSNENVSSRHYLKKEFSLEEEKKYSEEPIQYHSIDSVIIELINTDNHSIKTFNEYEHIETSAHYIGKVELKNQTIHVMSIFKVIQLAISKKGMSSLIFLDTNAKSLKNFDIEMPDLLPVKISNNQLIYFRDSTFKYYDTFDTIPKVICSEDGCFE